MRHAKGTTSVQVGNIRGVLQAKKELRGKLFGDWGYISAPLTQLLFEQGLHLVTQLRKKNMTNHLMHLSDKLLLRKRVIIESITEGLKNMRTN